MVVGLVAELDGLVVGHVQLNRSWLDARAAVDVLVLSPLSVGPATRPGIGSALVAAAIAAAPGLASRRSSWRARRLYYAARGFPRPTSSI